MEYFYDVGGNLDEKKKYAFAAGDTEPTTLIKTANYTYGDTAWKDKMTTYDGVYVTYDAIGNPLTDGEWTYTWTQGRKLATMSKTGTNISYKYNSDGIRTEKTVDGVKTFYNVVGDRVTWEQTGSSHPTYYLYDASGMLWAIQYHNGTGYATYFYVRNAQGDIIKLIDKDGTVVVTYDYDAWGNLLKTGEDFATTLGKANPYRYRGYRYDEETELYYLQSRYYNPQWGRFVNADALGGVMGAIGSHNIFSYCHNNPVNLSDPSGLEPVWAELGFNYDGSVADFKRLEQGLPPLSYANWLKSGTEHDVNRRPNEGTPDSTWESPNGDKRTFGPDGSPQTDYDHDDHGYPDRHPHDENGGHSHDWVNGKRGSAYVINPANSINIESCINWQPGLGATLVVGCAIGIAVVAADDVTGIGIADDVLFAPLGAGVSEGFVMIFG